MQQASNLAAQTIAAPTGEKKTIVCDKHGEFVMNVFVMGGKERAPVCPSCHLEWLRSEAAKDTRQIEELQASMKKAGLSELLGHSGIPPRYIKRGFGTYNATTPKQNKALELAQNYAVDFAAMREEGKGLLFIGSTGTGKTHLATAICKAVIREGFSAYFTSVLSVMQVIKETYGRDAVMSERKAIAKFVEPDLLALDEIGVQHNSDTERMFLTEIVNQRYEQMKPTILLSNLPLESQGGNSLMKVLGERIISRLREVNDLVICDWEDYRARTR